MTTSLSETLEDFALNSSTPIPPAYDSSQELQEDVSDDMTGVCTDTTKKVITSATKESAQVLHKKRPVQT